MLHIVFVEPRIAGNTGATIRTAAATGATLHLVEPLGFELDEPRLRRAGLDYHDMAHVVVHPGFDAVTEALPGARFVAFTAHATRWHTDVDWRDHDALVFGPEPTGLDDAVLTHRRVAAQVRIPMLSGRRSVNLANAAAIGVYEAWRALGFAHGE
ncbi:MAG: tRNA (cytidine(34)-2'-O)-methyltransferase [Micrococcales bacterium]|nr:tRNA (cytidine(34)-2'-O)-methyltransferase [Micrococcales bacterium]MCL2666161.1 tRNA (cytidine(34)-2'-O)-methyltransferase [Micrococcales bacterium]